MLPTRPAGELKPLMAPFRARLDLKWPLMVWFTAASPPARSIRPASGSRTCIYELLSLALPAGRLFELGTFTADSFLAGAAWQALLKP